MTDITELAQREKFEAWFKSSFHPGKTGPYIKDQLYFAWKAAGAELVDAVEKAQQRISELESRTVKLPDDAEHDIMAPVAAYLSEKFKWDGRAVRWDGRNEYDALADRVKYALRMVIRRAAGIKVEAE